MSRIVIAIALVERSNELLLIQRSLQEGSLNWQFPAGRLEKDEDCLNAAARETFEETGIKCKPIEKIGTRVHPETGIKLVYVACKFESGAPYAKDVREVKKVEWVNKLFIKSYIPNNLFHKILTYYKIE